MSRARRSFHVPRSRARSRMENQILRLILLCVIPLTACSAPPPPPVQKLPDVKISLADEMKLRAGDLIEIEFVYWPELNVMQAVRSDGKICVGELDYVTAAGMTTEDLGAKLCDLYKNIVKDPVINVVLVSRDPEFLYVGGQVQTPGILTLMPMLRQDTSMDQNDSNRILHGENFTLAQVIVAMGGFVDEKACRETVAVIRYVDGKRYAATFDMSDSLLAKESETVYLAANDIVYVPRTRIEKINQWVDQHINKAIPTRFFVTRADDPISYGLSETNR